MIPTASFDELQRRWVGRVGDGGPEVGASAVVVCPSLTFPLAELRKITGIEFYEERMLFALLLLRDPGLEVLYPTSVPVDDAIVDYYLGWLPDPAGARARLHLFPVRDPEPGPLVDKLLARPDLVTALRGRLRDPGTAFLLPFTATAAEARLAAALGVPLYGTHPDLVALGSKSGARQVAVEAGVDVFEGAGDLSSLAEVEAAIQRIRAARPRAEAVVVKLNNGFSGQGNVILELDAVRAPLPASPAVFCAAEESWATFGPKVQAEGAVVEELARVPGLVSPSVQLRILPGGRCEVVSTHDQILGGPEGQVYLGCRFPAHADYRLEIQAAALRVAGVLAARGALGSFGIDFVVLPAGKVLLSEINLRLGGTTHPFQMVRHVTGGHYVPETGELLVDGEPRVYVGGDNVKSPRYVGLAPGVVIDAVARAGLAYDPGTRTGATLHLLGALATYGKLGLVCIARSHDEADRVHARVVAVLDALAEAA